MRSLSPLLVCLITSIASRGAVAQDSSKDLGTVLKDNDNLSTFYELIQVTFSPYISYKSGQVHVVNQAVCRNTPTFCSSSPATMGSL